MNVLLLSYRGEALREFELRDRALEVGRDAGCDIVIHDPTIPERHLLITARGGTVFALDLTEPRNRPRPFGTGEELPIGRHHSLTRLPSVATRPHSISRTEPLGAERPPPVGVSLVLGRGSEARRVALDAHPLTIGSAAENDVVLHDRAVSARHCRIEPSPEGLRVRDLGSRNGTLVDGVGVSLARVGAGSVLRVGRTDLRFVARGRAGDARSTGLIAESTAMLGVLEEVERIARHRWPTLVTGESGTGKEWIARAIHERGTGPRGPFVAVNAGGMPSSLVESELFGHTKGAFTGASSSRRGVFEQADGGTLFLDEIGELPLDLQARLLRVLETWEIRRLGAEESTPVNVRLVCATHRDLRQMVADGDFRQDLYFRVAVLGVHIPPLRDRPGDLEALARHFLEETAPDVGAKRLSEGALERMRVHSWPGNVRELRNLVRRLAVRSTAPVVEREEVVRILREMGAPRELDRDRLGELVERHHGNLAAAARALGIPRTTLRDRLRRRGTGRPGDHSPRKRA